MRKLNCEKAGCPYKPLHYHYGDTIRDLSGTAIERLIAAVERETLERAAAIAKGYRKDTKVCGDECLARTACSDIYHDIRQAIQDNQVSASAEETGRTLSAPANVPETAGIKHSVNEEFSLPSSTTQTAEQTAASVVRQIDDAYNVFIPDDGSPFREAEYDKFRVTVIANAILDAQAPTADAADESWKLSREAVAIANASDKQNCELRLEIARLKAEKARPASQLITEMGPSNAQAVCDALSRYKAESIRLRAAIKRIGDEPFDVPHESAVCYASRIAPIITEALAVTSDVTSGGKDGS